MYLARLPRLAAALAFALTLYLLAFVPAGAAPVLLQEATAGSSEDRARVIIWTLVAVGVAMLLIAVGYVYRRAVGVDKAPPVTLLEPGKKITGD